MLRPALAVGIAGGTGSGKTTIVRAIYEALEDEAALLDQDSYYRDLAHLPPAERRQVNFDHPDAFDNELMLQHLAELIAGNPIEKPVYDYGGHVRTREVIRIEPRDVILVDGILLLSDARLRTVLNLKVFIDVAESVRFVRRLRRDTRERKRTVRAVLRQYVNTVRPMHEAYVQPSKRYADIVLHGREQQRTQIAKLLDEIRAEVIRRRSLNFDTCASDDIGQRPMN